METPKEILKKSTVHTLSINEGSPLQDAVISAMKEYAECKTAQLKADKAELLELMAEMKESFDHKAWVTEMELKSFSSRIESLIQKNKP